MFKVGDKVRALKDDWDISKGEVYTIMDIVHGRVCVMDNGDTVNSLLDDVYWELVESVDINNMQEGVISYDLAMYDFSVVGGYLVVAKKL